MSAGFLCGPAKGTAKRPYRCICCRVAYKDAEALGVSICWRCMSGNTACAKCRKRGIPFSDFRVGGYRKYRDTLRYYTCGGRLHRFTRWLGSLAVMRCNKRIPRVHLAGGAAVVPACGFCWPQGVGALPGDMLH